MERPDSWKPEEVSVMRKYYPTEGWRKVHELTGRSRASIHCKAGRMGISGQVSRTKRQWNCKFTPDQVREIRANRQGWTQARLAAHYGTTQGIISRIQTRTSYPFVA